MAQKKFDDETIGKIARARRAGAGPTDIGRQFGCTPQYVINASRAWETRQKLKAFDALSKRHDRLMRQVITPPPMETPDPEYEVYQGMKITKVQRTVVGMSAAERKVTISLPYYAIRGGRR